jgi:hypothetical protein
MRDVTTCLDPLAILGAPDHIVSINLEKMWRNAIPVVNVFAGSVTSDKTDSFDRGMVTNSVDGRDTSMDNV